MKDREKIKSIVKAIIITAVLLIPVIYSFFYLKSYWDPYGHLTDMKVGILNLDKGEKNQNRGSEFEEELKKSGSFDFISIKNQDEAEKSLGEDEVYAVITIPENFTENLNSASSDNKKVSTIIYTPNKRKNYLASQILNSALKTVELNLESKISKEVTSTLADNLKDVPDNLNKIYDGAEQIDDGAIALSDGLKELSDGIAALDNKYVEFDNGIESAYKGSQDLSKGIGQIGDGIDSLSSGTTTLSNAISQVNNGVDILEEKGGDGIRKLTSGIDELSAGSKSLNDGISQYVDASELLANGIKQYVGGTEQVLSGMNSYVDGAENLARGTSGYIDGVNAINDNKTAILMAIINMSETNPELAELAVQSQAVLNAENSSGLKQSGTMLKNGATTLINKDSNNMSLGDKLKYGAGQLTSADSTGISAGQKLVVGGNQLAGKGEDGISSGDKLKLGSKSLNDGINTLKNGASGLYEITNGIGTLKSALSQISDGTKTLNVGVGALKIGNNKINNGAKTLSNGLSTLNTSSYAVKDALGKLNTGSISAFDGSIELKNGTATFKNEIKNGLETSKEELTKLDGLDEFVQDPIRFEEQSYGNVDSYGVAFAPLFISIGLWVGALMCYVVLYYDQKHRFGILDHDYKGNRIIQNLIYLAIGAIMGIITGIILKIGLGYNVESIGMYLTQCMLTGLVFMALIQFLIRNFGDVGKFIALIILVLQLAASGGTFPVETIDNSFKCFNGILPMTYTIKVFKDVLVSTEHSLLAINTGVLIGMFAIITILGFVFEFIKLRLKNKEEAKQE